MSPHPDSNRPIPAGAPDPGTAWIRDPGAGGWLRFQRPCAILAATRPEQVPAALAELARGVAQGRWAAGFLAYEAAPAFDPALATRLPDGFPLLWFGLYETPEIVTALPGPGLTACRLEPWQADTSRDAYHAALARIRDLLAAGATYQVNYTIRLRSRLEGEPWALFADLAAAQQADYAAFLDTGEYAIASASPELFFLLDGHDLRCKPMKGTAARGRTLAEDRAQAARLRASEKDRAENVMIVDMIRNDMSRVARPATVAAPRLFDVERYPTVWQMTSTVTCRTLADVPDIFAALFPCASITGAPKPSTMRIIADLETAPRRLYTGCLGYWAPNRRARFNVAIRTVIVRRHDGLAEYGVGGGIVWDSVASAEYQECLDKARILSEPVRPFSLLETLLWTTDAGFFLLDYHLRRLAESAEYFGFPLDAAAVRRALDQAVGCAPASPALRVRLLLDPGGAPKVECHPFDPAPPAAPLRVALAARPIDPDDRFLYHKTTRRRAYDEVRAARPGFDDVLLWNTRGELTESTIANVILEPTEGPALTPPISCGLLPGTYRAWLLDQGAVRERIIPVADLKPGCRLVLVNSLRGRREAVLDA